MILASKNIFLEFDTSIPIIIDAKHYEEVRNKKGPLTKDEEVMAEKYYNAQLEFLQHMLI